MVSSYSPQNPLWVYLLGCFRIERNNENIHFPTQKIESLFAYLILNNEVHLREKLAGMFWGESNHEAALCSLRNALSTIRRLIGKEILITSRETVKINFDLNIRVDYFEFLSHAKRFLETQTIPVEEIDVNLYGGLFMKDFYDDWVFPYQEQTQKLFIEFLLLAVTKLRVKGEYRAAINFAQRLLSINPSNERAHQHLMFCFLVLGERHNAIRQFEICRDALQRELDVEPSKETTGLFHWIRQSSADISSNAAKRTNLPIPISSFIGRNNDLKQIKELLFKERLVTLTGPGGSGKTRLAIQVSTDLMDMFRDGVWWVDFSPVTEESFVPNTLAKVLGIVADSIKSQMESLNVFLTNRQLLLVFDNCEHLVSSIGVLTEKLLTNHPGVKILATSREVFGILGENIWYVPSLTTPAVDQISIVELLMGFESIRLFVERAGAVRPGYILTERDATFVVRICQKLDGIPLAIELAAARMKMMLPEQIAEKLTQRFDFLISGSRNVQKRHQTLRGVIDWSFNLLNPLERLLFCRLSVFSDGWTILSAERICVGDGIETKDILFLLSNLVDKSLILFDGENKRYRLLETIRQYAAEKLDEIESDYKTKRDHLLYFSELAALLDDKIRGHEQLQWLALVKPERGNFTIALDRGLNAELDINSGASLVSSITHYLFVVGDFLTANYWMLRALEKRDLISSKTIIAKLLFVVGAQSVWGMRPVKPVQARKVLTESLNLWTEMGEEYQNEQTKCVLALGWSLKNNLNDDQGIPMMKNSMDFFKESGDLWWEAWASNLYRGCFMVPEPEKFLSCFMLSDQEKFLSMTKAEMALWKKVGDQTGLALIYMDYGIISLGQKNYEDAEYHLLKSLEIYEKFGSKGFTFQVHIHLAEVYYQQNKIELSEKHFLEDLRLGKELGWTQPMGMIYYGLGFLALRRGDGDTAEQYFLTALSHSEKYVLDYRRMKCFAAFACLAVVREQYYAAADLLGVYFSAYEKFYKRPWRPEYLENYAEHSDLLIYIDRCKINLTEKIFHKTAAAGAIKDQHEVVAELLGEKVFLI